MNKLAKHCVVCLVALSLLLAPLAGTALAYRDRIDEKMSSEKMTADLLIARPVGLFSMLAGGLLFAVALPFTLYNTATEYGAAAENTDSQLEEPNSVSESLDKFVIEPSKYTFQRRLGRF
jgi:hypothetical protein